MSKKAVEIVKTEKTEGKEFAGVIQSIDWNEFHGGVIMGIRKDTDSDKGNVVQLCHNVSALDITALVMGLLDGLRQYEEEN